MITLKNLEKEIAQVSSLGDLTQVYGEIASIRMKKIRDYVLKNRDFLSSIEVIFKDALSYYQKKISGSAKRQDKVTLLAHNGKTVAVLISANTGFYGNVVRDVYKRFVDDISEGGVEITIIGRLGRTLFLEEHPNKPYTYFELPDYGIDSEKLSEAVGHLVQYEEIKVYYGKYHSVVKQEPTRVSISAGKPVGKGGRASSITYIFEPSVEKILMFFETQIFASVFDQSIRESQLAKFASRILSMDRASENIKKRLHDLTLKNLKIKHRTANRKQLNSMASVAYQ